MYRTYHIYRLHLTQLSISEKEKGAAYFTRLRWWAGRRCSLKTLKPYPLKNAAHAWFVQVRFLCGYFFPLVLMCG